MNPPASLRRIPNRRFPVLTAVLVGVVVWAALPAELRSKELGTRNGSTFQQHLARHQMVFTGSVSEKVKKLKEVPCPSSSARTAAGECDVTETYYVFSIDKVFKGKPGPSVEMLHEDSCPGLKIDTGRDYLIYARRNLARRQWLIACETQRADEAEVKIIFLNALANNIEESRVYPMLVKIVKTHSSTHARTDALRLLTQAPAGVQIPDLTDIYVQMLDDSSQEGRDMAAIGLAQTRTLRNKGILLHLITLLDNKDRAFSEPVLNRLAGACRDDEIIEFIEKVLKNQKKELNKHRKTNRQPHLDHYQKSVRAIGGFLDRIKNH